MSDDLVAAAAEAIVAAVWVDAVRERLPGIADRLGDSGDADDQLGLDAAAEFAAGVLAACPMVATADVARVLVAVGAELADMDLPLAELLAAVVVLASDLVPR